MAQPYLSIDADHMLPFMATIYPNCNGYFQFDIPHVTKQMLPQTG